MECKVAALLGLLAACFIYSFFLLHKTKSKENYLFFGFNLLLLSLAYSVTVLKAKVSGANVGIEIQEELQKAAAAKQEVSQSAADASNVAATLMKMSFVVADGASRYGGVPKEHKELLKQYAASLKPYYKGDIYKEAEDTIKVLDEKIQKRQKLESR